MQNSKMKSSKNFFPQTAPTDEYNEISRLNVLGVDDQKALENLEKETQNQRRSGKTIQESSYGKVSISRILVFVKVSERLTLSWMNVYIEFTFERLLI